MRGYTSLLCGLLSPYRIPVKHDSMTYPLRRHFTGITQSLEDAQGRGGSKYPISARISDMRIFRSNWPLTKNSNGVSIKNLTREKNLLDAKTFPVGKVK